MEAIFPQNYRSLNGRPGGTNGMPVKYEMNKVNSNELYNLKNDPSEEYNVYEENIEIAKKLEEMGEELETSLEIS